MQRLACGAARHDTAHLVAVPRATRYQWPGLPDACELGGRVAARLEALATFSWMPATARPDPM